MTLEINYTTTNPRKVDQILEEGIEDVQSGKYFEENNRAKATWWSLRGLPSDYIGIIFFKDVGVGGSFTRN